MVAKAEMREQKEECEDAQEIKPKKFVPKEWQVWLKQFDLYLSNVRGKQRAPLDYVVCKEPLPPSYIHTSERERNLYKFPLRGALYREDNCQVYRMLSDLVTGTEGDTWIEEFSRAQDGRAAWLAMKLYYEGGGNERNIITQAETVLDKIHYSSEVAFPFELFSAALLKAFRDLQGTESEKSKYEKIRTLLRAVRIQYAETQIHKNHVRQNH